MPSCSPLLIDTLLRRCTFPPGELAGGFFAVRFFVRVPGGAFVEIKLSGSATSNKQLQFPHLRRTSVTPPDGISICSTHLQLSHRTRVMV